MADGKLVHHNGRQSTSTSLADKHHTGHALYEQALHGLQKWNHDHHIKVDSQSVKNAAGALAVEAHQQGLKRIDHVEPSLTGDKIIAAQGPLGTAHSKVIDVPTVQALNTPLAQSSQAFSAAEQTQGATAEQARQVSPSASQQAEPAMSR